MKSGMFRLLAVTMVVLLSCSKQDTAKPAENPITQYIDSAADIFIDVTTRPSTTEAGTVFRSNVNGRLTQVGVRMPEAGTYRATLWDVTTKAVLRQKLVEQATGGKLTLVDVDPLALVANQPYVISVTLMSKTAPNLQATHPYFGWKRTTTVDFLPVIQGSITMLYSSYTNSVSDFPGLVDSKWELVGFADFTFIPD